MVESVSVDTIRHIRKYTALVVCALALALLSAPHASRAQNSYLIVDGVVSTPLNLSEADFRSLPRKSLTAKDADGHDVIYEGVDLSELLARAGVPLRQNLKGADVAKYLHVEGGDGFVAVISLPEFDQSGFLVADTENGSPLPGTSGPLQIISPNEMRHSRWVKHLQLLRIKTSVK